MIQDYEPRFEFVFRKALAIYEEMIFEEDTYPQELLNKSEIKNE